MLVLLGDWDYLSVGLSSRGQGQQQSANKTVSALHDFMQRMVCAFVLRRIFMQMLGMVGHSFNPSRWEAEAGGPL